MNTEQSINRIRQYYKTNVVGCIKETIKHSEFNNLLVYLNISFNKTEPLQHLFLDYEIGSNKIRREFNMIEELISFIKGGLKNE